MNRVVPWSALVALIEPHAPRSRTGRPPFAIETMLRIHFLQQWFSLSDLAMEEALNDVPLYREFAGLEGVAPRLPDKTTILRFRHLLEAYDLAARMLATVNDFLQTKGLTLRVGTAVDATLIAAPSSTKNQEAKRDPEMHPTKKGNQWQVAMRPGKRRELDKSNPIDALTENIEKLKASVRAKVEHPLRVSSQPARTMRCRSASAS